MRFLSAFSSHPSSRVPALVLGLSLAGAAAASSACSSKSDGAIGDAAVFVPGFDAGHFVGPDGGTVQTDGGFVSPGPDGSSPGTDATATHDTGVVSPGQDAGMTAIPSSGIVITVIPDTSTDASGLLSAIENAKMSVHVEMYLLTNTKYIDALITLKNAGKDVKVILNQTFPSGSTASTTNGTASSGSYATLKGGGVDVVWSPTTTGFDNYTHEKTVIIDQGETGEQAWIMTMNLDTAAPKCNREYLAQDTNSADIAEAEAIFEGDYAQMSVSPSGNLVVAPTASPSSAAQILLQLVSSATTSIDMEAEEIDNSGVKTEEPIFAELVKQAKAGVQVRLVLEDSDDSAQTTAVTQLEAAGVKVLGYAYDECNSPIDIHAKAIVVDGARAYIGSENFTGGSLGYNRELGVYFTDPTQVNAVYTTIQQDFANASPYSSSSN